jgi:hypothetical protein
MVSGSTAPSPLFGHGHLVVIRQLRQRMVSRQLADAGRVTQRLLICGHHLVLVGAGRPERSSRILRAGGGRAEQLLDGRVRSLVRRLVGSGHNIERRQARSRVGGGGHRGGRRGLSSRERRGFGLALALPSVAPEEKGDEGERNDDDGYATGRGQFAESKIVKGRLSLHSNGDDGGLGEPIG